MYGNAYGPRNFGTLTFLTSVVNNSKFDFRVYYAKGSAKINYIYA